MILPIDWNWIMPFHPSPFPPSSLLFLSSSMSMFFQPLPSTMLRYFLDRSVRMTVSVVLSWNELPFSSFPSLFKILVTHRPTYTPSRNFSFVLLYLSLFVPTIFPRSKASFSKGLENSTISESIMRIMSITHDMCTQWEQRQFRA